MNARLMMIVVVLTALPAAGGCGAARNILFNPGAACGRCAAVGPTYDVAPPAYGAPGYGQPAYGAPGCGTPNCGAPAYGAPAYGTPAYGAPASGCGSPQCGGSYGGECGCGGEYGSNYYGDYGYGEMAYPGGSNIGSPAVGNGLYGGYPNNSYIPDNGWVPSDANMVPGSMSISDGIPAGAMAPVPRTN